MSAWSIAAWPADILIPILSYPGSSIDAKTWYGVKPSLSVRTSSSSDLKCLVAKRRFSRLIPAKMFSVTMRLM